jgi:hypothetical protein
MSGDSDRKTEALPGWEARRFTIENGDGEPALLHPRFVLQRVKASWFCDEIEGRPAWLVRVAEGSERDRVFALTARGSDQPIEKVLVTSLGASRTPYAGVILHAFQLSPAGDGGYQSYAAGMTVLEELR